MTSAQNFLRLTLLIGVLASNGVAAARNLTGNLDSRIRWKTAVYPAEPGASDIPDADPEDAHATTELLYTWNAWFQLDGGIRLDTTGWIEAGLPYSYRWAGGIELFQDTENLSRPVVLNELYATLPAGPFDFLVGRTIQRNTVGMLYPLADRYVARDFSDPTDPKIFGTWQARADFYMGDWNASAAVLPVFQPGKIPGMNSRWWIRRAEPITGQPIPPGSTGTIERDIPGTSTENTGLLANIATRQQHLDFYSTVYHGYSPYAVFRLDTPAVNQYLLTMEYVPGFEWSAGASATIDAIELHTEALYHRSYSGKDDDYINALGGILWRLDTPAEWLNCDQIRLILEYAREFVLSEQDASNGYASSSEPFRFGQNTFLSELFVEITSRDSVSAAFNFDFKKRNSFTQFKGGHRFGNGMKLELVLELFAGSGLYYGTWQNNDRLYLNYDFRF
jgi:hypothetical protein